MLYYTAVLPENVLFGIGVSFLFVIVWKLMKVCNQVDEIESNYHRKIVAFLLPQNCYVLLRFCCPISLFLIFTQIISW